MESQSMDDSLCILYENLAPPPEVEIVNEIERTRTEEYVLPELNIELCFEIQVEPSQTTSGVSQANVDDDSVRILQENKPRQVKKSSPIEENVAANSRNQKRAKIECGICFDSLNMILDSNRNLGSTICGHVFCNTCMEMSRKTSSFCPACRKRLGKNQFHPLYF